MADFLVCDRAVVEESSWHSAKSSRGRSTGSCGGDGSFQGSPQTCEHGSRSLCGFCVLLQKKAEEAGEKERYEV